MQMQPADARLRIRFLLAMTIVAAAGGAGILYLDSYLGTLHSRGAGSPLAAERALAAVRWVLALIAGGGVLFSLYLGSISWRTWSSERFPPPGARVISDTRVWHGRQARRRGQLGLALAAATFLLILFVTARAHRLFAQLLDTTLKPTPYYEVEAPPTRPSPLP